ncbi:MAG: NPCBM/NEW2 domain-containing protein [Polaromonas sp.]|nr:NPCBM/NEW2 domain-containing protein [Polaromonas sp.]
MTRAGKRWLLGCGLVVLSGCGGTQSPAGVIEEYPTSEDAWTSEALQGAALQGQVLPAGSSFLSDLPWTKASNGYGPIEKDRSNGGIKAGDGKTLTLEGQTFAKGLGVHAKSDISYALNAECSKFSATVGLDDEVGQRGSVVFQVLVDGKKVFDSGVLRGNSASQNVNVPLMGVKELRLNVTGAGDGTAYDHADWADAKLECGPVVPPPAPGPVVVPPAPGISTVSGLLEAATQAKPGDTLTLAAGTFELLQALKISSGVSLRGAGAGKTIITNASSFSPGNAGLDNDEGASVNAVDCSKYLINLGRDTADFSVTELTLTGTNIPGGICGIALKNVTLSKLEFKSFLWAGARLFVVENLKATDNTFFDAGNKSNVTSGSSGGALFLTYFGKSEIANNRFSRSVGNDGYGIKGREARNVRIHHNTIDVFFSIELPFESDHFVEIDHNFLGGAVSLPKYAGGTFPDGGYSFRIHHNYFNTPYALEFQRNGIEVDHNLFDFPAAQDYGNLISGFDAVPAPGGLKMHNNLIRNPGRGIYWNEGVYNNFAFYNNHVRGQTTVTPRTEGLFDFRSERDGVSTDFSTVFIRDNIFELTGIQRPLMRNSASYAAIISNNTLTGISDTASYANPNTGKQRGLTEPLCFRLGAYGSLTVKDWTLSPSPSPVPNEGCSP